MLKRIFSVLWRLAALALCVAACVYATRYFSGYYRAKPLIGLVDPAGALEYVDAQALADAIVDSGEELGFLQVSAALSVQEGAEQLLEQGVNVLVVCLDNAIPNASFIEQAIARQVTLIFVGTPPAHQALANYDKVWYVDNDIAHGAQLLGKQLAYAFRDGTLPDQNDDLLLQYAALIPRSYPQSLVAHRQAMLECEHYGVYTQKLSALVAEPSLLSPMSLAVWSGTEWADPATGLITGLDEPLAQPELLLCVGTDAAYAAQNATSQLGWTDARLGGVVESEEAARSLTDSGVLQFAAYYDQAAATSLVAAMCINAADQRFVGQDLELMPDEDKTFVIAYQILE